MIEVDYFYFPSKDGKTQISAKTWQAEDTEPIAIVQIVHGMLEHKERYNRFAEFLAEKGFLVVAHDHLGHGESVVNKKKLGYMTKRRPSDVLIEDMNQLRIFIQESYEGLPYIILGHSMGSYMLRKYLSRYGEGLDGAIIMGTGYEGVFAPGFGLCLVHVLAALFGWTHRSNLVQAMTYNKYYRMYDLTGEDHTRSWLCKDLDIVARYWADPKCTYTFTLSGYKGLLEAVFETGQMKNIKKIPRHLPLILTSGAEDPVGKWGKAVQIVYDKYRKAGLQTDIRIYENDRHEILNELDYELVQDELLAWMKQNCLKDDISVE